MYWLNCPVTTIAAHASLVFAMRIQLADYTPPGAIHLQWQLLDPAGASVAAEAVVTVVASPSDQPPQLGVRDALPGRRRLIRATVGRPNRSQNDSAGSSKWSAVAA